jgi:cellulose synthase/poly-beta-1,6-N-acetylglucosamine synthase-like glycosyltransferase
VQRAIRQAPPLLVAPPRRRTFGAAFEHDNLLAHEIAFLTLYGVSPAILLAALSDADGDITSDRALLGAGHMPEGVFYELLARHLGAPFYHGQIPLDADLDPYHACQAGIARLAANPLGFTHVLAPRGAAIRLLLWSTAEGRLPRKFMIATPQRFGAEVRAGAQRTIARDAADGLRARHPALSAHGVSVSAHAASGAFAILCQAAWFVPPAQMAWIASIPFSLAFAANVFLRLAAITLAREGGRPPPPLIGPAPVYSIIAPLYREANMLPQLIAALDALDYPKAKLDIKIVIEAEDHETLHSIAGMRLPGRYEVIVAPPGQPRTKPRAMNVALPFLRGAFAVVYDAEDQPDPDQLRRAVEMFAEAPDVACLQARLVIDNARDSWLTRMFAIEYAMLFDVVNPGLAAMAAPIPLGGSSNHFRIEALRASGGWDAWNVTEDADLGLRLARLGLRVGTLESDTLEEAPATLPRWLAQRRRWLKGWMQTAIVHGRAPRRMIGELGWSRAIAAQALVAGTVLGGLFGPMFFFIALWWVAAGGNASTIAEAVGRALALALLLAGIVSVIAPAWIALRRRGMRRLMLWAPLLPAYYVLISLAAWFALYDLIRAPSHWVKTDHGLARTSMRRGARPAAPFNAR